MDCERARWSVQRLTLARAFDDLAGVVDEILDTPQFYSPCATEPLTTLDRACTTSSGIRPIRVRQRTKQ